MFVWHSQEIYKDANTQVHTLRKMVKEKEEAIQRQSTLEKKIHELEKQGTIKIQKKGDGDISILPVALASGMVPAGSEAVAAACVTPVAGATTSSVPLPPPPPPLPALAAASEAGKMRHVPKTRAGRELESWAFVVPGSGLVALHPKTTFCCCKELAGQVCLIHFCALQLAGKTNKLTKNPPASFIRVVSSRAHIPR